MLELLEATHLARGVHLARPEFLNQLVLFDFLDLLDFLLVAIKLLKDLWVRVVHVLQPIDYVLKLVLLQILQKHLVVDLSKLVFHPVVLPEALLNDLIECLPCLNGLLEQMTPLPCVLHLPMMHIFARTFSTIKRGLSGAVPRKLSFGLGRWAHEGNFVSPLHSGSVRGGRGRARFFAESLPNARGAPSSFDFLREYLRQAVDTEG